MLHSLVMLIDKNVKIAGAIVNDLVETFVNRRTLMFHFVQHCGQYYDIPERTLLEYIDLIQNHIGVQNNVVWKLEETTPDVVLWSQMKYLALKAILTQIRATANVISKIMLSHNL